MMTDQPGLEEAKEAAHQKLYGRDTAGLRLVGKVDAIVIAAYPIIAEHVERAVREKVADAIEKESLRMHKNFPCNKPFLSEDYISGMDEAARLARGDSGE